jgi:hypothetical protein
MALTWCKLLARVICGPLHTDAQPEPLRSWRGEPLTAVGKSDPGTDPYRTLIVDLIPERTANSCITGSTVIPPAPGAHSAERTDLPEKTEHCVA